MQHLSDQATSRALEAAVARKGELQEKPSAFTATSGGVGDRVPDNRFAGEAMGFGAAAAKPDPSLQAYADRFYSGAFSPVARQSAPQARPGRGEVA